MLPRFHFSQFDPDDSLRFEADKSLDEILEIAPEGTIAIARLEKDNDHYRCAIDLYSKHGPFIARTFQPTPLLAIHHATKTLKEKLLRIRSIRGARQQEIVIEKKASENAIA